MHHQSALLMTSISHRWRRHCHLRLAY